jgi:NAD(P)-dependent dehydrogenase (short-subunit alcohol dehydrogenase family)
MVPGCLREIGWRPAVLDRRRRVRTGGQEQLDHLDIAVLGGFVERGIAAVLGRVDVGAGCQQQPAHLDVAARGRRVERLVGEVVRCVGIDPRTGVEQDPCDFGLPEEGREMEGGETVGRHGCHRGRIVGEALPESVDPTQRGRLEYVEIRVGREQGIHRRAVETVAREQERRDAVSATGHRQGRVLADEPRHELCVAGGDRVHQLGRRGHAPSVPQRALCTGTMAARGRSTGMRLADKVTIITGAGGGMGRVAARIFAGHGARVVVAEYSETAGQETVDLVAADGGEATFVRADVSREADAKAMVDHAVATYGRLDVLYNNAGVMPEADHSVTDTSVEVWDQVMAVNVRGVFLGCKYAVPAMEASGGGSIINISSFVALLGCSVPQDAYTASKGAVLSLTRSLAVQFAPKGIRTNAICPGPVETPLLMDWLVKDEEAKRIRLARNPTGRFGKPEEIVHMAVYLASDESRWTNGASLVVDGGITVNYF